MRREDTDRELHDYLDGRLGEKEREAFEKRTAENPAEAQQVAFYRDLGHALRHGASELPPGFLARARARFEASRPPRSLRRRIVSWEAAGVAAAALLLVALFFPLVRNGTAVQEVRTQTPEEPSPRVTAGVHDQAPTPSVDALDHTRAGRNEPSGPARRTFPVPPPKRPDGTAPEGEATAPPPSAAGEKEGKPEVQMRHVLLVAPAAPASAPVETGAGGLQAARESRILRPRCEALPQAVELPAKSLIVISSADQEYWKGLLTSSARFSLDRLHPDFQSERVVLIGPRSSTPIDCQGVEVDASAERVRIRLLPAAGRWPCPGGCAVTIPAGSSPVEIESAPVATP